MKNLIEKAEKSGFGYSSSDFLGREDFFYKRAGNLIEDSNDEDIDFRYLATIKIEFENGIAYIKFLDREKEVFILESCVDFNVDEVDELIRIFNGFSETLKLKELFWL